MRRFFTWLTPVVALLVVLFPPQVAASTGGPGASIVGWGSNGFAQLGDGTTTDRAVPVRVLGEGGAGVLDHVAAIAAGESHSLALLEDGTVWAWGDNSHGQLGDSWAEATATSPVQVVGLDGTGLLSDVTAISAGGDHSLALLSSGEVVAWGGNNAGQLGNGNGGIASGVPVQVTSPDGSGVLGNVESLAAAADHSLAVRGDGTAWAWGRNDLGQLGDGNVGTGSDVPVQVVGVDGTGLLTGVVEVAAGENHNLARLSDGSAVAWGYNAYGELGDNNAGTDSDVPVRVLGTAGTGFLDDVIAVAAGEYHSLAVLSDNTVRAWGADDAGQLGDNASPENSAVPVQVLGQGGSGVLAGIIDVAAGEFHSVALHSDGTVWSFGHSGLGESGTGVFEQNLLTPAQVLAPGGSGGLSHASAISVSGYRTLAIVPVAEASLTTAAYEGSFQVGVTLTSIGGATAEGYYVAESPEPPPAVSILWSSEAPIVYPASGEDGERTLYGFVKDALGYVSAGAPATVIIDTTAPEATLSAPDLTATRTIDVTAGGSDANGLTGYYISEGETAPAAEDEGWTASAPESFTLADTGDGERTIYLWTKDPALNVSDAASATVVLDTTVPTLTLSVPGATASLTIDVTVEATDASDIAGYYVSESSSPPAAGSEGWSAEAPTSFDLAAGDDGDRTVYAWAKDAAGNVSDAATDSVKLDTEGPSLNFVVAPRTNSLTLAVGVGASDASEPVSYYLAEDATPPAADDQGWLSEPPSYWTLDAGPDGDRTVYLWGKDALDNVSAAAQATTSLDRDAPTVSVGVPGKTNTLTIGVTVSGGDSAGAVGYHLSEAPAEPSLDDDWAKNPPTTFALGAGPDGLRTVYAWTVDAAGNISDAASDIVALDRVRPVAALVIPSVTASLTVAATASGGDDRSAIAYYLSASSTTPTRSTAGWSKTRPVSFPLPAGPDGVRRLYLWTLDGAGNVSLPAIALTRLDRAAPSVTLSAPARDARLRMLRRVAGTSADPAPGTGVATLRIAVRWKQGTTCRWWKPAVGKLVAGPCGKPVWISVAPGNTWAKAIGTLDIDGGYAVMVEATDAAGNVGEARRAFTIQ